MNWNPKYAISNRLLLTIREIGESIGEIKSLRLTDNALAKLELQARELSSYASTSIEGNPLPLTDVKRLLKSQKKSLRDTEREVLNYNQALETLHQTIRAGKFKLDIKTIEKTQGSVVKGLMDNPAHCGCFRKDPVVIRNPKHPDEIIFIPPDAKDVRSLMSDLIKFVNTNIGNIDPIVLAAVFHRQCVIIHPFMDGNGRTTRLITTAILGKTGLDLFEIFSFENYYNRNISRYFKEVGLEGDYYEISDDIDFTNWLEYFSDGILDELRRVVKLLPAIDRLKDRLEPHHKEILAYIHENGSITQREYGAISTRSLAARKLDFEKLVGLRLIVAKGVGRGTYYISQEDE